MNVASVVTSNNCFENIRLRKFLTAQSILELCGFYCSPKLGYHLGGKNKPLKSSLAELTCYLSFKVQVLNWCTMPFFFEIKFIYLNTAEFYNKSPSGQAFPIY